MSQSNLVQRALAALFSLTLSLAALQPLAAQGGDIGKQGGGGDCPGGGCTSCVLVQPSYGIPNACFGFPDSVVLGTDTYADLFSVAAEPVGGPYIHTFEIIEGADLVTIVDPVLGDDHAQLFTMPLPPGEPIPARVRIRSLISSHPCSPDDPCAWTVTTIWIDPAVANNQPEDCNGNFLRDEIEIELGLSADCNLNALPDECDLAAGTSLDLNGNGYPDECECGCLDVVWAVDNTGSMDLAIEELNASLPRIQRIAEARGAGDARFGLVTFTDCVTVEHPLTSDLDAVRNTLAGLEVEPGGEFPEASDDALREILFATGGNCINPTEQRFDVPFRPECDKLIVMVTDAEPGGCLLQCSGSELPWNGPAAIANAAAMATEAAMQCIRIAAMQLAGSDSQGAATLAMTTYAQGTGGWYASLPADGAGLSDALLPVVNDCVDCNQNGQLDYFDILSGLSLDLNLNGVPDECESCLGDIDLDGAVGNDDLLAVLGKWGEPCCDCPEDLDGDGMVGQPDLLIVLGTWGPCP